MSIKSARYATLLFAVLGLNCGASDDSGSGSVFRHAHTLAATGAPVTVRTPSDYRSAYNVPATQTNYSGTKAAIIVAYHYANLQADHNVWAKKYNLPPSTLNIINQAGVRTNSDWALEEVLDVAMLRTATDVTTIYVIEAKSAIRADFITALGTAVNLGVDVVTMSFGGEEFYSEGSEEAFNSARGVTWIAASGDNGVPLFPATHPGVVAVGASSLSSLIPRVETTWSDTGCGESIYMPKPSFQRGAAANTTTQRSVPDVSFNGNPSFGVEAYCSILGGWIVVGGTSVSAPFFAGIVSLANGSRKHLGKQSLSSGTDAGQPSQLQNQLYQLSNSSSAALHDIVSGSGCGNSASAAGPGYDLPSGLGSVDAQKLIDYLTSMP